MLALKYYLGQLNKNLYQIRHQSSLSLEKYEATIKMRTCRQVYEEKANKGIFKNCPRQGIDIEVKYVDTNRLKNGNRKLDTQPTVLALHGAPGTYGDYMSMVNYLSNSGVRVISPNFPDMSITDRTGYFRHTTEEKYEFLQDFLDALKIKRLDSMVIHSSACYPGLKLFTETDLNIRSLVIMNPSGHRTIKAMKPEWLASYFIVLPNLTLTGRKLFSNYAKPVLDFMKVSVKTDNLDSLVLAATTMYLAKTERLETYLNLVRQAQCPTLYIYSDNDGLVDKKISEEMGVFLGATESDIIHFDRNGKLVNEPSMLIDNWIKVMRFEAAGHYSFINEADKINLQVAKLLRKVCHDWKLIQ